MRWRRALAARCADPALPPKGRLRRVGQQNRRVG